MASPPLRVGCSYYRELERIPGETRAQLRVLVTRPPYPCAGMGELRILAERRRGPCLEWVLAYERYHRLGS